MAVKTNKIDHFTMASQKLQKRRRLFLHNKTIEEAISCMPSSVHIEEGMEVKERLVAWGL
jgi:hypothetical protein